MPNDPVERLRKLVKMRADGVLSDEEFTALKAKLIEKMLMHEASGATEKTEQQPASANANSQTEQKPNEQPAGVESDSPKQAQSSLAQLRDWLKKKSVLAWGCGVLVVCVLSYFLFSSSGHPDCGSSATQDLIVQNAKDHPDNRLINYVIGNSELYKSVLNDPQYAQRQVSLLKEWCPKWHFQPTCQCVLSLWGEFQPLTDPEVMKKGEAAVKKCEAAVKEIIESRSASLKKVANDMIKTASYTLDTIRMNSNANTKAVSCVAKLNVQTSGGGAQMEINYKVEKMTDGKMYATVYGL
jgi:hypothetical protein